MKHPNWECADGNNFSTKVLPYWPSALIVDLLFYYNAAKVHVYEFSSGIEMRTHSHAD